VDLSTIEIDSSALKDEEPVSVFYFSDGPQKDGSIEDYFYRYQVTTMEDKRVNVLSPFKIDVNGQNYMKYFYRIDSEMAIVIQGILNFSSKDGYRVDMTKANIQKVVCNRHYKKVENNDYPTIIGFITDARPEKVDPE